MARIFENTRVQAVFDRYQKRADAEHNEMQALGSAGMARRDEFLLPIGIDAGRFLHSLVLARKPARIFEVGTSYGYSTLFLADAASTYGGSVVTLDLAAGKQRYAKLQMESAGLESHVEFRNGDAVDLINKDKGRLDFVLIDIWKELYVPCLEAVYPKLAKQGLIVADNMYSPAVHIKEARKYRKAIQSRPDLQTLLVPIGSGIELTCRWPLDSCEL